MLSVLLTLFTPSPAQTVQPVRTESGFVLHGTNSGIVIYDKKGNNVDGVPQSEFNDGIDPKMVFDVHNRVFIFDLWNPGEYSGSV